jgi:hypothetical protein
MEIEDVGQLKAFYDSPAGHKHCRIVREKISELWPDVKKEKLIGFGFTLPYLPVFVNDNQTIALMPTEIGALDLHQEGIPSVMADESQLPLRNEVIDRILTAHALENIIDPQSMVFEFWRILKPYGRVLFIFDREKFDIETINAILFANKFNVTISKRAGFFSKIQIMEAQKIVFAPRGRTQKIIKSLWDKLTRPKPAMEPQGV